MPNAAAPEQVLRIISDPQNAHPDEVKWSGIADWLKEKGGKVSKQEVLDYLKANNIQVQEVRREDLGPSGAAASAPEIRDRAREAEQRARQAEANGDLEGAHNNRALAAWMARDAETAPGGEPKYEKYALPGGNKYRELLLTWGNRPSPTQQESIDGVVRELGLHKVADNPPAWEGPYGDHHYYAHDLLGMAKQKSATDYKSGHWDEPNILAHVRFNDRTDANGKKTLFIEEVQSDWHQEGREKGYQNSAAKRQWERQLGEARQAHAQAEAEKDQAFEEYLKMPVGAPGREERYAQFLSLRDRAAASLAPLRAIELAPPSDSGVQDAPFKKNWHELALKRMLRWGAENGYDQIAWTTGEQQAHRYNQLLDGITKVHYNSTSLGNGRVGVQFADGRSRVVKNGVKPEDLPGVVGKDIAAKMLAAQPDKLGNREVTGENIKIGGEGMKGFYDKMLPEFLNKYGKKWGAQVGETQIAVRGTSNVVGGLTWHVVESDSDYDTGAFIAVGKDRNGVVREASGPSFATREEANRWLGQKVHSIPITPAMKKSVLEEGQPIARATEPPPGPAPPMLRTPPPSRKVYS